MGSWEYCSLYASDYSAGSGRWRIPRVKGGGVGEGHAIKGQQCPTELKRRNTLGWNTGEPPEAG